MYQQQARGLQEEGGSQGVRDLSGERIYSPASSACGKQAAWGYAEEACV